MGGESVTEKVTFEQKMEADEDPGKALGGDHATKRELSSAKAPRSYLECRRQSRKAFMGGVKQEIEKVRKIAGFPGLCRHYLFGAEKVLNRETICDLCCKDTIWMLY